MQALLMHRTAGLPANWMSTPPILATIEGIVNSMLTNLRSTLKKTVSPALEYAALYLLMSFPNYAQLLESLKPGFTTDIAQLAKDLIKSKMGSDFQCSYELWARFAIWVRASVNYILNLSSLVFTRLPARNRPSISWKCVLGQG